MNTLNDLLMNLANEAGEVAQHDEHAEHIQMGDILGDELAEHRDSHVTEMVSHAEKANSIASDLEEIAERAEELAGEDQEHLRNAVSVESLHREFRTLMRAHNLSFRASSFESEVTDLARLQALSKDARRTSGILRGYSSKLMDYSQEGSILQWFRGDKKKLYNAGATLRSFQKAYAAKEDEVKDHGVVIKHNGLARFLTVNNHPVKNFKEAIDHDAHYLDTLHSAVESQTHALISLSQKLGNDSHNHIAIPRLDAEHLASGENTLLGNYTIDAEFKRDNPIGSKHGEATGKAALAAVLSYIGWSAVAGLAMIGIGLTVGASLGASVVRGIGSAAGYGVLAGTAYSAHDTYKQVMDSTGVKSLASASDISSIIQTVLGFEKYTKFTLDKGGLDAALDRIKDADNPTAVKEFKEAVNELVKAVDAIYEHAYYVTINTALLVQKVTAGA